MTADQSVHLSTGAFVLDALPVTEHQEFEQHLHTCDACAREVPQLRDAAAQLGLAAPVAPPARLRARVLEAVARTRQLPTRPADLPPTVSSLSVRRAAGDSSSPAGSPAAAPANSSAAAPAASPGPLPPGRPAPPPWWRSPLAAAAAALLVATAGLGGLAVVQDRRIDRLTAAAGQDAAEQQRAAEQAAQAQRIARLVSDPARRTVSAPVQGGGVATAVLADGQALMLGDDLPSLPAGRAYQLWVIRGTGNPRSAGVVEGDDGTVTQVLDDVRPADVLGVSVEPAAGSTAPTTTPILLLPV